MTPVQKLKTIKSHQSSIIYTSFVVIVITTWCCHTNSARARSRNKSIAPEPEFSGQCGGKDLHIGRRHRQDLVWSFIFRVAVTVSQPSTCVTVSSCNT